MLRAEALIYAAQALPNHPHAAKWKHMAQILADDSMKQWEIEDATVYHPVWLTSLYSYADATAQPELFDSPLTKYYQQYFLELIGPQGTVPEFGDARWFSGLEGLRFVAIFEKGAAVYKDPELKWAAKTVFETARRNGIPLGVAEAYIYLTHIAGRMNLCNQDNRKAGHRKSWMMSSAKRLSSATDGNRRALTCSSTTGTRVMEDGHIGNFSARRSRSKRKK